MVLGPAAIHRRNHAASFSLVLSIALTLHTFLSCTPKKNMGSLNYVCTCLWDEHGVIPRPRFHSLGTGEDSGGLLVKSISGKHELSYKDSRCDSAL